MDPTKIRMRYLLVVLFAAIIIAAVLRHVLHVNAGFTRLEILEGALACLALTVVVGLALRRRRREWNPGCRGTARLFPISQQHGKARNAPSAKTYEQARWLALDVTGLGYLDVWVFSQPQVFLRSNIARVSPQDKVLFYAFLNGHPAGPWDVPSGTVARAHGSYQA
jgi:hypothetical protein